MGWQEINHRVAQAARGLAEKQGIGLASAPEPDLDKFGLPWIEPLPIAFPETMHTYIERADRVLAGRFSVFAMPEAALEFPPNWHRDPKTGTVAPLEFGKSLDYRDNNIVGDIKYLWEPSRHLELVHLAQAWHLSGENRFLDGCRDLLDSWFEQNPYPMGVHWTSSLELALRLINWSFAWHLVGGLRSPLFEGDAGVKLLQQWLLSVYQHCHFICRHFSRFSSANNHLMGEYAGLFFGAITWPCWSESSGWLTMAQSGLEEEAALQHASDGGNREQAVWYQHEVADMLLLAGVVGRRNGVHFSDEYWSVIERSLEFLASLSDVAGNMPMIGDSDDAVIVDLSAERQVYKGLLASGALVFNRGDFKAKAQSIDDKTQWLLGDYALDQFANLPAAPQSLPVNRAFPESGYWVLGSAFETDREIRVVADAGPLGYLSIAAHGHADALAMTLSVAGIELLIDPGTYAYHTQQAWRDFFKGTSAHNTVRVDGQDQSSSLGNFMWGAHAKARCLSFESGPDGDQWIGEHLGYRRLNDPLRHQRTILYEQSSCELLVTDLLECAGKHDVELHWHAAEHCDVSVIEGNASIRSGEVSASLDLSAPGDWTCELIRGQESPPLGWISRRFDIKEPSAVVRYSGQIKGTTELTTRIRISLP